VAWWSCFPKEEIEPSEALPTVRLEAVIDALCCEDREATAAESDPGAGIIQEIEHIWYWTIHKREKAFACSSQWLRLSALDGNILLQQGGGFGSGCCESTSERPNRTPAEFSKGLQGKRDGAFSL
jgi:hypothetical protein